MKFELLAFISTLTAALITSIFGPIVVTWIKSKLENKNEHSLKEAFEINEEVDRQLDILLDKLKCNRIWITQFHNGGHFYPTGKSIQKFSIFYEKVSSSSFSSIQNIYQNIPTSLFPKTLAKLYKEGELIINLNNKENYSDLSYIFDNCGAQSLYMLSLKDLEEHFVGIISISYDLKEHNLTQEEWIFLRQKLGAIGSILTNYLKTQKK
jgi:hypothetical protein